MDFLLALLAIGIGLTLVFSGYRLARIIIPMWGFISGLALGAAVMASLSDTPIFGTFLGIIVGFVSGIVFAVAAYLYYSVAVIVAAGLLGYWIASSLLIAIGISSGLFFALVGTAAGVVAGLLALLANAPRAVLIIITAFGGALTTVGGILLLFNVIPLDYLSYDATRLAISGSFFWSLATLALAATGAVIQSKSSRNYSFEKWAVGHDTGTPTVGSMTSKPAS